MRNRIARRNTLVVTMSQNPSDFLEVNAVGFPFI
jgi:hypothetical protein